VSNNDGSIHVYGYKMSCKLLVHVVRMRRSTPRPPPLTPSFRYIPGSGLRITLLRPSVQSLAVTHVITSDPLRCQPYWCRPRVVRLSRDRSFPVAAARAWNALPQLVRNAPSLPVFRRELKTFLFRSSFPDVIWQWTVLYLHVRRPMLLCHHLLATTNRFC